MTTGPVSGQYMRKSTRFYINTTFFLTSQLILATTISVITLFYYSYHVFCKTYYHTLVLS